MRNTGESLRIHNQRTKGRSFELRVDTHLEHVLAQLHPDARRFLAGACALDEKPATEFVAQTPQATAVTIAHEVVGGTGEQILTRAVEAKTSYGAPLLLAELDAIGVGLDHQRASFEAEIGWRLRRKRKRRGSDGANACQRMVGQSFGLLKPWLLLFPPDAIRRRPGNEIVVIAQNRQIPGGAQVVRNLGLDGNLSRKRIRRCERRQHGQLFRDDQLAHDAVCASLGLRAAGVETHPVGIGVQVQHGKGGPMATDQRQVVIQARIARPDPARLEASAVVAVSSPQRSRSAH